MKSEVIEDLDSCIAKLTNAVELLKAARTAQQARSGVAVLRDTHRAYEEIRAVRSNLHTQLNGYSPAGSDLE